MMELLRRILFLPPGVSSISDEVDALHVFVITSTMIGVFAVFAVATYFSVKYRRRLPRQITADIRVPFVVEALVAGGLLTLFLTFWVLGYRQFTRMRQVPEDPLVFHVMAKQWMWKFVTPGGRRSQGVIVVPRGRSVQLRMTSRDVIHSFFVPAFRLKQDVLPGRTTTLWFRADRAGSWPIFCAEYCGLDHARMLATIVVLDGPDYARWIDGEWPAEVEAADGAFLEGETMASEGREVAARYGCFACHTIDGQEHVGPTWRGLYGSIRELADGQQVLANDDYLTQSMMDPESQRVAGFDLVMPSYEGVLSAVDTAAVVEFIRSLRLEGPAPAVTLPPTQARVVPDAGSPSPGVDESMGGEEPTRNEEVSR